MIRTPEELFAVIDNHFFEKEKLKYSCFFARTEEHEQGYTTGKQLEGWFKGELIYLFSTLQQQHCIQKWKCEVKETNVGVIDFRVDLGQQSLYIETKVAYLGRQGKSTFSPAFYLNTGKKSQYIAQDMRKLKKLADSSEVYCMVFVYPSPESPEVQKRVHKRPKGWDTWEKRVAILCNDMKIEKIDVQDITSSTTKKSHHLYIARFKIS